MNITIPPEALEAGARAYTAAIYKGNGTLDEFHEAIRVAFLAMVKAWEGMETSKPDPWSFPDRLILPLPQEKPDGE